MLSVVLCLLGTYSRHDATEERMRKKSISPCAQSPPARPVQETDHPAGSVSSLSGVLGRKGEENARQGRRVEQGGLECWSSMAQSEVREGQVQGCSDSVACNTPTCALILSGTHSYKQTCSHTHTHEIQLQANPIRPLLRLGYQRVLTLPVGNIASVFFPFLFCSRQSNALPVPKMPHPWGPSEYELRGHDPVMGLPW